MRGREARIAIASGLAAAAVAAPAPAIAAEESAGDPARPVRDIRSNERGITYWSSVLRSVSVRARPSREARRVGRLGTFTWYGRRDMVIVLRRAGYWSHVRYSGIGRRTGWVPTSALSTARRTRTWVVIHKRRRLLTAYRGKRRLLRTRVGIGAKGSPTPGGRFFIRDRVVPRQRNGIYGPVALGLSAYSRHRTDWPGGGQVGIHGTNQPGLIPGRISNGCVRLPNRAILRLDRIVSRGTPVRIR
jgi:lipoprotein-anchoring transpeptidase ErfK/SrfK